MEVLAARVGRRSRRASRTAALARTLGDAAAAAATEVLYDGAAALTRARDSGESRTGRIFFFYKNERERERSKRRRVARRAAGVGRRAALRRRAGRLKGVTAAFRMTNKPMPTKPSHFANGVVEPLRRFAESGAVRGRPRRRGARSWTPPSRASAPRVEKRRRTSPSRSQDGSLADPAQGQEGGEGKGIRRGDFGNRLDGAGNQGGPTDAEKICRQVRLDAEAFGRAVARLGFDPEKSDAFAKLWEVCEGDAFSSA